TFSYRNTTHIQVFAPNGVSLSDYRYGGQATGTVTAYNGLTLSFDEPYYILEVPCCPSVVLENRPGYTQRYFRLDLSVVKRLSHNWMLRANVGWNSFRQYLTPQSILDPNDVGAQNDNGAPLLGFANWQFNVNGLYEGPWGLTFGANLFGRQGYPAN